MFYTGLEDSVLQIKHVFWLPTLIVLLIRAPDWAKEGRTQFSQAGRVRDMSSVSLVTLTISVK